MAMFCGYVNDCGHSSRANWLILRIVGTALLARHCWHAVRISVVHDSYDCYGVLRRSITCDLFDHRIVYFRGVSLNPEYVRDATRWRAPSSQTWRPFRPPFLCVRSGALSAYHASEVYLLSDNDASRIVGIDHTMRRIAQPQVERISLTSAMPARHKNAGANVKFICLSIFMFIKIC